MDFYPRPGIPQQTWKRDHHGLADGIPLEEIPAEVFEMLDRLAKVAANAAPQK
jgi:hypothetical protein